MKSLFRTVQQYDCLTISLKFHCPRMYRTKFWFTMKCQGLTIIKIWRRHQAVVAKPTVSNLLSTS
jgi:hypothetical protein